MTRGEAREYLHAVSPQLVELAILYDTAGRGSGVDEWVWYWQAFSARRGFEGLVGWRIQSDLLPLVAVLEGDLTAGVHVRPLDAGDLTYLPASAMPEIRLLAIRLAGRKV